jgi:phosphoribosylformimino-5-aminoimidazole carboxamide ribonucleotide (ProFAR) isomerase
MAGPDLDQLGIVLGTTAIPVIASGGVGDLGDIMALASLEVRQRRLLGAIVGKALYEGRFRLAEALLMLSAER